MEKNAVPNPGVGKESLIFYWSIKQDDASWLVGVIGGQSVLLEYREQHLQYLNCVRNTASIYISNKY